MIRSFVVVVVVVTGVLGSAERARACGPDFPARLLADRKATMGELVEGTFADDAAHLVTPSFKYRVVEDDRYLEDGNPDRLKGGDDEKALYEEGATAWHREHDRGAAPSTGNASNAAALKAAAVSAAAHEVAI